MPKRYRNLWPELVSFENLWLAYLSARRGKRGRPAVAAYELDAELRLLRLQERLQDGSYQPGAYRSFVVREWKRRLISAAPFEDRIVHHAICRVIEPLFERRFVHDSYAAAPAAAPGPRPAPADDRAVRARRSAGRRGRSPAWWLAQGAGPCGDGP